MLSVPLAPEERKTCLLYRRCADKRHSRVLTCVFEDSQSLDGSAGLVMDSAIAVTGETLAASVCVIGSMLLSASLFGIWYCIYCELPYQKIGREK